MSQRPLGAEGPDFERSREVAQVAVTAPDKWRHLGNFTGSQSAVGLWTSAWMPHRVLL